MYIYKYIWGCVDLCIYSDEKGATGRRAAAVQLATARGRPGGESVVERDLREGQVGHRRVCMFGMQLRDSDPIRGILPWARCRSGGGG